MSRSVVVVLMMVSAIHGHAQSIGDVAKKTAADREAAKKAEPSKTFKNEDLKMDGVKTTADLHGLQPVEDPIDRKKFEKVYAAGMALREAILSPDTIRLDAERLTRAFSTEVHIAGDHAETNGEHALATNYLLTELEFELVLLESRHLRGDYEKTLESALVMLRTCNDTYLGKPKPEVKKQ